MTKKELQAAYEESLERIERLKAEKDCIKNQKNALVREFTDMESLDKATDDLYLALAENLTKSLKAKMIVNMKPEERDNLYYLFEAFGAVKGISIENRCRRMQG